MADKKDIKPDNQTQPGQLNIELNEEVAEGIYSNLAILTHSNAEFVIDFIKVMPGTPKAKVKSRILLTPQHIKRLLRAMKENIAKYEQVHGEIQETEAHNAIPLNFGGPTAQA
ncbi:MAG: hypothetical protein COA57_02605 [Flavobacteriales bacterium]|nr:MAG: hypothetical protein COA57_02605 [Flavobacteriales bacterium]